MELSLKEYNEAIADSYRRGFDDGYRKGLEDAAKTPLTLLPPPIWSDIILGQEPSYSDQATMVDKVRAAVAKYSRSNQPRIGGTVYDS